MIEISAPKQVFPASQETSKRERTPKYNKPHMIIPAEDMEWALQQRPPVLKLWNECWLSDPYGSRWMPLKTSLKRESLKKAKRLLIETGLFLFKSEMVVVDGVRHYEWFIKNAHGSRSTYWQLKEGTENTEVGTENTEVGTVNTEVGTVNTEVGTVNTEVGTVNTTQQPSNPLVEAVSERLSISSVSFHKHFISLSVEAKKKFLEFCLKEMAKEKFEIRRPAAWIAANFSDYWEKFRCWNGDASPNERLTATQDWANHPKREEWIAEIRKGRPRFVALGGPPEENETRRQFAAWAEENNLVWENQL
jgi:hypothetical protein